MDLPMLSGSEFVDLTKNKLSGNPALYGFSPGLCYYMATTPNASQLFHHRVSDVLASLADNVPSPSDVIRNVFSGDPSQLQPDFDLLSRRQNSTRVWIPGFLFNLLDRLGLSDSNRVSLQILMEHLGDSKLHSGEAWEWVTCCVLFLRILYASLNPGDRGMMTRNIQELFPPLPKRAFDVEVMLPREKTMGALYAYLHSLKWDNPTVIVCYSWYSGFPPYDSLVAVYDTPSLNQYMYTELAGYQNKSDTYPKACADLRCKVSVVLWSLDSNKKPETSSATDRRNWICLEPTVRTAFLGATFDALRGDDLPTPGDDLPPPGEHLPTPGE